MKSKNNYSITTDIYRLLRVRLWNANESRSNFADTGREGAWKTRYPVNVPSGFGINLDKVEAMTKIWCGYLTERLDGESRVLTSHTWTSVLTVFPRILISNLQQIIVGPREYRPATSSRTAEFKKFIGYKDALLRREQPACMKRQKGRL